VARSCSTSRTRSINAHNLQRTERCDFRPLALFEGDEQGGIVAGLSGFTWAGWLEIKFVWVREDLRCVGRGRELVQAAKAEAWARGCERVWLDSYSFLAPASEQRLGYEVFGVLHGDPAPHEEREARWKLALTVPSSWPTR
jgi:GNAT superfamily N-acetyltransferase